MTAVAQWYRKYETPLLLVLLLFAGLVLCVQITSTLIDYDEATYAKVVVDTIKSGDVSTFTLSGHLWFEKPPLYLWLAIGSVNLFGAHEFAFRVPSKHLINLRELEFGASIYLASVTRSACGNHRPENRTAYNLLYTGPVEL